MRTFFTSMCCAHPKGTVPTNPASLARINPADHPSQPTALQVDDASLTTHVHDDDGRYAFYCKIALAPRLVTSDPSGRFMVASGDERLNHMIAPWTGCDWVKRLGVPTTVQAV